VKDTYTAFEATFLVACYLLCEETGREIVESGDVLDRYRLSPKPNWVRRALSSFHESGYTKGRLIISDDDRGQPIYLSALGVKEAERLLHEGGVSVPETDNLPEGTSEITGGRVFLSRDSDWTPSNPREGDIIFRDELSAELLPASDRLVPLDHNSAPYREVKEGLAALHEAIRASNDLPCSVDERDRLLASISAAQQLWDSAQLKIIQIKVGIIITLEDAFDLLSKAGKAFAKVVLIDTVKSIVKHKTGIEL
jgi:hypothetical protein